MKHLYSILCLVFFASSTMTAQSTVSSLLKKYNNDKEVLAFNLTGNLLNFFEEMDEGKELKSEVENLSVLMFNIGNDVSDGDRTKMKSILKTEGFDALINAKHEGQKVKVYAKDNGEFIEKLFAIVKTETHNIYVNLDGEIHYDDLSKINVDQFGKTGQMFKN